MKNSIFSSKIIKDSQIFLGRKIGKSAVFDSIDEDWALIHLTDESQFFHTINLIENKELRDLVRLRKDSDILKYDFGDISLHITMSSHVGNNLQGITVKTKGSVDIVLSHNITSPVKNLNIICHQLDLYRPDKCSGNVNLINTKIDCDVAHLENQNNYDSIILGGGSHIYTKKLMFGRFTMESQIERMLMMSTPGEELNTKELGCGLVHGARSAIINTSSNYGYYVNTVDDVYVGARTRSSKNVNGFFMTEIYIGGELRRWFSEKAF